jgi:hypothetical protein
MSETIMQAKEKHDEQELLDPEDPPIAELADCTCPDFCERDHANE